MRVMRGHVAAPDGGARQANPEQGRAYGERQDERLLWARPRRGALCADRQQWRRRQHAGRGVGMVLVIAAAQRGLVEEGGRWLVLTGHRASLR
eukprot:6514136-Prymnesium_polylepis.1